MAPYGVVDDIYDDLCDQLDGRGRATVLAVQMGKSFQLWKKVEAEANLSLSSPASEPSPNAFSPPWQSPLYLPPTGRASLCPISRGGSNACGSPESETADYGREMKARDSEFRAFFQELPAEGKAPAEAPTKRSATQVYKDGLPTQGGNSTRGSGSPIVTMMMCKVRRRSWLITKKQ
jgi:hypothetical protein